MKPITRSEIARMSFCNSPRLPGIISIDGTRTRWVGIGWVEEGEPRGDEEALVVGDGPSDLYPCGACGGKLNKRTVRFALRTGRLRCEKCRVKP